MYRLYWCSFEEPFLAFSPHDDKKIFTSVVYDGLNTWQPYKIAARGERGTFSALMWVWCPRIASDSTAGIFVAVNTTYLWLLDMFMNPLLSKNTP